MTAYIISFLSQKGGCGKSTLARLFAQQLASSEISVLIADMDIKQQTSSKWVLRRAESDLNKIDATIYNDVLTAMNEAENYNAIIFDGAPHATQQTLEIAKKSDLIIIPTGAGIDDLEPNVILANDLSNNDIKNHKIVFALFRTDKASSAETKEAREYLNSTNYKVLDGELYDKPSYRRALDAGRAPSETINPITGKGYENLNADAIRLANSMGAALTQSTMKG